MFSLVVHGELPTRFYLADSVIHQLHSFINGLSISAPTDVDAFSEKLTFCFFHLRNQLNSTNEFIHPPPLTVALFLVTLSSVKGHQTAKGNILPHANFQRSYAKGKKKRALSISCSTEEPATVVN